MSIQQHGERVRLHVYVQPRAARSEVVGPHGDALKIRLAAPPVDGAANDELLRFLAKLLHVPASSFSIVSGSTARRKVVDVSGLSVDQVQHALLGEA